MARPELDYVYITLTTPSTTIALPVWLTRNKYEKIIRKIATDGSSQLSLNDKEIRETKRINNGVRTTNNIFADTTDEFFSLMSQLLDKDALYITYCDMPKDNMKNVNSEGLFDIITPKKKMKPITYNQFKKSLYDSFPLREDGVTSNSELESMAKSLGLTRFSVICDTNQLDGEITCDSYHIINISRKPDEVGHWTVVGCDGNEKKYYFDSFGVCPPLRVRDFLGGHYIGSNPIVQEIEASDCGLRCLFIIFNLQHGVSFEDILDQIHA